MKIIDKQGYDIGQGAIVAALPGTDFLSVEPLQRVSMIVRMSQQLAERIEVRTDEVLHLIAEAKPAGSGKTASLADRAIADRCG